MPPPHVKSIRQLIYWQYAKIITASSGFSKKEFGMVIWRFVTNNRSLANIEFNF